MIVFEILKNRFFKKTDAHHYQKEYVFTEDWFTPHIPIWKKELRKLIGKSEIQALEIGTFQGRSAIWLLENVLTAETSRLTCIDPFLGADHLVKAKKIFIKNLKISGFEEKVEVITERSEAVLPRLTGKLFDLIYIDGHHEGDQVHLEGEACWKLLKANGFMIFDDYLLSEQFYEKQSPREAIDAFLEKHQHELRLLHKGYQVFLQRTGSP